MGTVISLQEYRERRATPATSVGRLELAVSRLAGLIQGRDHRLEPTLERELREIVRQVSAGSHELAADRAERLLGILSHPALSG